MNKEKRFQMFKNGVISEQESSNEISREQVRRWLREYSNVGLYDTLTAKQAGMAAAYVLSRRDNRKL